MSDFMRCRKCDELIAYHLKKKKWIHTNEYCDEIETECPLEHPVILISSENESDSIRARVAELEGVVSSLQVQIKKALSSEGEGECKKRLNWGQGFGTKYFNKIKQEGD